MLVACSDDDPTATYAAQLAQQFHYWYVVVSGGVAHQDADDLLKTSWPEATESEHFAAVMQRAGLKKDLLLEKEATNTGENATYSFKLLQRNDAPMPLTVQLVTKTYMERRTLATFEAQWPDKDATFMVTSPHLSFADYINSTHSP